MPVKQTFYTASKLFLMINISIMTPVRSITCTFKIFSTLRICAGLKSQSKTATSSPGGRVPHPTASQKYQDIYALVLPKRQDRLSVLGLDSWLNPNLRMNFCVVIEWKDPTQSQRRVQCLGWTWIPCHPEIGGLGWELRNEKRPNKP